MFGPIIDKAKVVELLMLYCVFSQRSEEDFRAKNARILCQLQFLLANANVSDIYLIFFEPDPPAPSLYLRYCGGVEAWV